MCHALNDRSAEGLARVVSGCTTLAGVRHRFRIALRLDAQFIQESFERFLTHVVDDAGDQALDQHQSFTGGHVECAEDKFANRRVIEPRVEWALLCIDNHCGTLLLWEFVLLVISIISVSYTHLRAHETGRNLVCRLLLEKKKKKNTAESTSR